MAIDFDYSRDRDLIIDSTGDFVTVFGASNIELQHVNAMFRAVKEVDDALLDKETVEEFKIAARNEILELSGVSEIVRLEVTIKDRRTMQVTLITDAASIDEEVTV